MDITEYNCKECGCENFVEVQEKGSEYTAWRQVLAWFGFLFLILLILGFFVMMFWTNNMINEGMKGI